MGIDRRKNLARRLFWGAMGLPVLPEIIGRLARSEATVFMAHRFSDPELGVPGHNPACLRSILSQLRKRRYDLISLEELFHRVREHKSLARAVVFTIDDGYYDAGQVAAPIFAEFDCPATIFSITEFLAGNLWLWWDKITYIFNNTKRTEIGTTLGHKQYLFDLKRHGRLESSGVLAGACYEAPEADCAACIAELSRAAEVELPSLPPAAFRPLSWDEARALQTKGISFGPHTLTHPILSHASIEQCEREIAGSWNRLLTEVSRPVPVFCYPGGSTAHFGEREIEVLRHAGLWGAVTGNPGNALSASFESSVDEWYRIPRFHYSDSLSWILQCVSGVEMMKARLHA